LKDDITQYFSLPLPQESCTALRCLLNTLKPAVSWQIGVAPNKDWESLLSIEVM